MTIKVPAGELRVLQLKRRVRFQATLCKKNRSMMKAVCGASWHSKLGEPLDVRETTRLSITNCGEIDTQWTPAGEGARRVPGPEGSRTMHKYPDTGGATLFDGVVDCAGSEFRVGGRERSNVVEFVTIGYSIAAVEVAEVEGRLQLNEESLPRVCTLDHGGCELEGMTLVIDTRGADRCRYVEVRKADFQRFGYGGKKLLVSEENKILLEEGEEEPLPADCLGRGFMQKTNFPGLFIYDGESGRETGPPMRSGEVDLEWETRVADFYMEYWALSLTMEGQAERQRELCELEARRLTEERVVLHGEHLLRMKGEVVHEFKCEWVVVTARAGYWAEGEQCMDHLPVFTAQQEVSYLAPITRVLAP